MIYSYTLVQFFSTSTSSKKAGHSQLDQKVGGFFKHQIESDTTEVLLMAPQVRLVSKSSIRIDRLVIMILTII
jgi:hypothetical protein